MPERPSLKRLPEFAAVVADGGDDSQAGDSHPARHRQALTAA